MKQKNKQTNSFFPPFESIGWDGVLTFILSNLVIVLSAGLTLLLTLIYAWRIAAQSLSTSTSSEPRLVLGMRLQTDSTPAPEFQQRLQRGYQELQQHPAAAILVLGGQTGHHDISEAEAGRRWLIERGISPTRILCEDNSRHTLENLFNARQLLTTLETTQAVVLISNRYHLARSHAMAAGLGIAHELCAAEDHWQVTPDKLLKLLKESYLLHWYHSGRLWATFWRDRKMLRRIS